MNGCFISQRCLSHWRSHEKRANRTAIWKTGMCISPPPNHSTAYHLSSIAKLVLLFKQTLHWENPTSTKCSKYLRNFFLLLLLCASLNFVCKKVLLLRWYLCVMYVFICIYVYHVILIQEFTKRYGRIDII